MAHQQDVAALWMSPRAEILVTPVPVHRGFEDSLGVVANVRARHGVAKTHPPVLVDADPVASATVAQILPQPQLPLGEGDGETRCGLADDERLARPRHRLSGRAAAAGAVAREIIHDCRVWRCVACSTSGAHSRRRLVELEFCVWFLPVQRAAHGKDVGGCDVMKAG